MKIYFFVLVLWLSAASVVAEVQKYKMENGVIQAEITSDIGGRVLSFSLLGKPNFLKVGESVLSVPEPAVGPDSGGVNYFGHEVWVGPQSQWWSQQTVNSVRAAERANWPPDPYLALAKNKILERSPIKIILQTPPSPVSGLALTKNYSFQSKHRNRLALKVTAKNIRREDVAWDIWFNTRVAANTQVYVPVVSEGDVRVNLFADIDQSVFIPVVHQGVFSLDLLATDISKHPAKVKLMIQPSAGWIAAFRNEQALILQFAYRSLTKIHPEQGQVELYFDYMANKLQEGVIEMEVHTPYRKLVAGEEMIGEERWTILPYSGAITYDAQLAFLRNQSKKIGLKGL